MKIPEDHKYSWWWDIEQRRADEWIGCSEMTLMDGNWPNIYVAFCRGHFFYVKPTDTLKCPGF